MGRRYIALSARGEVDLLPARAALTDMERKAWAGYNESFLAPHRFMPESRRPLKVILRSGPPSVRCVGDSRLSYAKSQDFSKISPPFRASQIEEQ